MSAPHLSADDLADIDETIVQWRTRGVLLCKIAPQFKCDAKWSAVRVAMIEWLLRHRAETALRRAA